MFAAMMFGLKPGGPLSPAQFWTKLSDEIQADISAFCAKWPPGQSKDRGCYREFPKVTNNTNHSDETTITPI